MNKDFYPLDNPVECPGAYTLDAYCKYHNAEHSLTEFPHQGIAQTEYAAKTELRGKGWRMHNDGTATCPKCMKRLAGMKR